MCATTASGKPSYAISATSIKNTPTTPKGLSVLFLVQIEGFEPTMAPSLNRMRLPIAPYLHMVRRAGLEPAHPSASVFETDSYTNSGICAFQWYTARDSNPHARYGHQFLRLACLPIPPAVHIGTQSETRTRMPVWAPAPQTGVSTIPPSAHMDLLSGCNNLATRLQVGGVRAT